MSVPTYADSTQTPTYSAHADFAASETGSNEDSAGPGLGGLSAANQTPSATAQHNPHDPYTNAYPVYPEGVPFNHTYGANIAPLNPAYYSHPHSPVNQHESQDQHTQAQHRLHMEQARQSQADAQHRPPMHAPSQHTPPQHPSPPPDQRISQSLSSGTIPPSPHESTIEASTSQSTTASTPPVASKRQPATGGSDDEGPPAKKRKQRTSIGQMPFEGDAEAMKDEGELGPGGGAKHWTDEEKSKLFHWTLDDDNRWKAFGDKMNTVFREGATHVFHGRKTFTALKSCYHRNVEVFKQIYAFEGFLARAPLFPHPQTGHDTPPVPSSSTSPLSFPQDADDMARMPIPTSFATSGQRHAFMERKIEAARALNAPVGNLTVKVVDHWNEMGWYLLFKKRFKEDPVTGQAIPYYPSNDVVDDADADAEGEDAAMSDHASPCAEDHVSEAMRRHLNPMDTIIPPPLPNSVPPPPSASRYLRGASPRTSVASQTPGPSHPPPAVSSPPQVPYGYPPPPPVSFYGSPAAPPDYHVQQHHMHQQQLHFQAQTAQTLAHLTNLTQTLLDTCSTLADLMRNQVENGRAQIEMMRRREEREESLARPNAREPAASSINGENQDVLSKNSKATLATGVLSNPNVSEEVRQAATEYLKKIFQ